MKATSHIRSGQKKQSGKKTRLSPVTPYLAIPLAVFCLGFISFVLLMHHGSTQWLFAAFPRRQTASWCDTCVATAVSIPVVKFQDTSIARVSYSQAEQTWPTPVSGIATTQEHIQNNIIIFGHSTWFGQTYPFSAIAKLKPNDTIIITDQFGQAHPFRVKQVSLVDRTNGDAVHAQPNLTLTLLTSARYNGQWLLPTALDSSAVDQTSSSSTYAILVITATPQK